MSSLLPPGGLKTQESLNETEALTFDPGPRARGMFGVDSTTADAANAFLLLFYYFRKTGSDIFARCLCFPSPLRVSNGWHDENIEYLIASSRLIIIFYTLSPTTTTKDEQKKNVLSGCTPENGRLRIA